MEREGTLAVSSKTSSTNELKGSVENLDYVRQAEERGHSTFLVPRATMCLASPTDRGEVRSITKCEVVPDIYASPNEVKGDGSLFNDDWLIDCPMTQHSKSFAHVVSCLDKWRGATARIWSYSISHKLLIIRLESDLRNGNLHLRCGDVQSIRCPTEWKNANLKIEANESGGFSIID